MKELNMADLSTHYLGMKLRNPIIVGSSGLTASLDKIRQAEDAGAGAVVLKSIFEEQIEHQVSTLMEASEPSLLHPEAAGYIKRYGRDSAVSEHLDLISKAKNAVSIPIIGSIHCVTAGAWTAFASDVEQAGADALELNVSVLPSDPRRSGDDNEQIYFDVAHSVTSKVTIPVALKIGSRFSSLAHMIKRLSQTPVSGLVLFNRFYRLDFDIEKLRVVPGKQMSAPEEAQGPLRWISILSEELDCDLAATTGVHSGTGVVKQILAGAKAVQICSVLYQNGVGHLGTMLSEVTDWMDRHGFESLEDFCGKMSQKQSGNPAAYERIQFMKASVGIE
jgi:dihydroorotate dehydrogenase (fumarate)